MITGHWPDLYHTYPDKHFSEVWITSGWPIWSGGKLVVAGVNTDRNTVQFSWTGCQSNRESWGGVSHYVLVGILELFSVFRINSLSCQPQKGFILNHWMWWKHYRQLQTEPTWIRNTSSLSLSPLLHCSSTGGALSNESVLSTPRHSTAYVVLQLLMIILVISTTVMLLWHCTLYWLHIILICFLKFEYGKQMLQKLYVLLLSHI